MSWLSNVLAVNVLAVPLYLRVFWLLYGVLDGVLVTEARAHRCFFRSPAAESLLALLRSRGALSARPEEDPQDVSG